MRLRSSRTRFRRLRRNEPMAPERIALLSLLPYSVGRPVVAELVEGEEEEERPVAAELVEEEEEEERPVAAELVEEEEEDDDKEDEEDDDKEEEEELARAAAELTRLGERSGLDRRGGLASRIEHGSSKPSSTLKLVLPVLGT